MVCDICLAGPICLCNACSVGAEPRSIPFCTAIHCPWYCEACSSSHCCEVSRFVSCAGYVPTTTGGARTAWPVGHVDLLGTAGFLAGRGLWPTAPCPGPMPGQSCASREQMSGDLRSQTLSPALAKLACGDWLKDCATSPFLLYCCQAAGPVPCRDTMPCKEYLLPKSHFQHVSYQVAWGLRTMAFTLGAERCDA